MSEPEAIDDQPDQTDQIDQFVGITNADERTARFYLGMAGGDMDVIRDGLLTIRRRIITIVVFKSVFFLFF